MIDPLRSVVRTSVRGFSAETLWRAALLFTAVSALIVVRACGYDASVPGRYAAYLLAHVMLPGLVAVRFLDVRPVDAGRFLALVLPAGFAVESLQFLSLAALGLKGPVVLDHRRPADQVDPIMENPAGRDPVRERRLR
ncbi:MAG: hypothetical protein ACKOTE_16660, partial [Opitutaceae bacterium]